MSSCTIFSSYTLLIFCISVFSNTTFLSSSIFLEWLTIGVKATTIAYVFVCTNYCLKLEKEKGISKFMGRGWNGLYISLSYSHTFFSHIKQRPFASNLHMQSC
jgi:hypothetical protein